MSQPGSAVVGATINVKSSPLPCRSRWAWTHHQGSSIYDVAVSEVAGQEAALTQVLEDGLSQLLQDEALLRHGNTRVGRRGMRPPRIGREGPGPLLLPGWPRVAVGGAAGVWVLPAAR